MRDAAAGRLIEGVRGACERLARAGWGDLLASHGLDVGADNLAVELARPLPRIDRALPGFEDFAWEGERGIEPGSPARSLLYHAFASPQVVSGAGGELSDFPTAAEIEAVESYVHGAAPPSVEELRARAGGAELAIVMFASEYRPAIGTVHGRHADTCFARTGIARIGTAAAEWDGRRRGYMPGVAGDGHRIRVIPCRYAPYVAARLPGAKGLHGPARFREREDLAGPGAGALARERVGDAERSFWIPLHKLFAGRECIRGLDLTVRLSAKHVNEKLRRVHLFFLTNGHNGGWCEPAISSRPFVLREGIAELSEAPDDGAGLLMPVVHERLVEAAEYEGKPLTFTVPSTTPATAWYLYPREPGSGSSLTLAARPSEARTAPEYLHVRHKLEDGHRVDLNELPDMPDVVAEGNYEALHYVDYTGDGWVAADCPELALDLPRRLPAYSLVATPDFFPAVKQSDLTEWTDESVAPDLRETIWPGVPGRPEALADQRLAADLALDQAGFDPADGTMTAIVGPHGSGGGRLTRVDAERTTRSTMLPDGAAGVFAPGWDASYDRTPETKRNDESGIDPGVTFLNTYGLGSPFPEDAKLCAALSSFWPAVAPDITRTFEPSARYATATPLTDEVIGLDGGTPWDGVEPPRVDRENQEVEYTALNYGDYVQTALDNGFHLTEIAATTLDDYAARTLTMARVYAALGARTTQEKVRWVVLSFRRADPGDADLRAACTATGRTLHPEQTYRFELFERVGKSSPGQRPHRRVVSFEATRLAFSDPAVVLLRTGEKWEAQ